MDNYKIERMEILLKAAHDLLEKQNRSNYVLNLLEQTAQWDDTNCDGYCLLEEIKEILEL